ncbi:MAG: glycoside hydrolase [Anaerolinea sp.]|nr:glycoside hydrolase [Anaerolinea sp.]
MDLYRHSINVILNNQDKGGAFIASPAFPTYHYCWLRDGSFIAHAMDRAGEHESSEKFFRWVGSTINRYAAKVDILTAQLQAGKIPDNRGILNTRFTLDGFEENVDSQWGNFQMDGYGSWLWGLAEHLRSTRNYALLDELIDPINVTMHYLKLVWQLPNYDCWEEHPEYLHPYSLATTYGGVAAIADLKAAGKISSCTFDAQGFADEIKAFLTDHAILNGKFIKHLWPAKEGQATTPVIESGVDASLLGLAVPYHVFDLSNTAIIGTVQSIEKELHLLHGGVYRYKEDVYYGGGEWILLTAWLGWYYALTGEKTRASELLKWIENNAEPNGDLPEQVSDHMLAPIFFEPWRKKWGSIASPLLWSHAMYILLVRSIEDMKAQEVC